MRARFAEELAVIERRLERSMLVVGETLDLIEHVLLRPDPRMTATIAGAGPRLRATSRHVKSDLVTVTAQQAPVAGDLRLMLGLMQFAHHGSLIANQFELIADQLEQIDPVRADPQRTASQLSLMTTLAAQQVRHATRAFAARDVASAVELQLQDDALDHINRQVFEAAHDLEGPTEQRELAFRYVLIARCLERIGDNAVDIAEQVVFLITAKLREFTDASHRVPELTLDLDSGDGIGGPAAGAD